MKINFKIAKYLQVGDVFTKTHYDEYTITFLKGTKIHQLRIVVNGLLTKGRINLISPSEGYKKQILLAIKEYNETDLNNKNIVTKHLEISFIEQFYSKKILRNIRNYLSSINKEDSRDRLTELGLIN